MSNEPTDKVVPFVDKGKVRKVVGLQGYKKPSYSNTTYGINKPVTQYVLVTPDMLSNNK